MNTRIDNQLTLPSPRFASGLDWCAISKDENANWGEIASTEPMLSCPAKGILAQTPLYNLQIDQSVAPAATDAITLSP